MPRWPTTRRAAWYAAQFPEHVHSSRSDPGAPYSCVAAVKQGDPTWLGFVNSVFRDRHDSASISNPTVSHSSGTFGDSVTLPSAGFPTELS